MLSDGKLQQLGPPQELYDTPGERVRGGLHRQPADEPAAGVGGSASLERAVSLSPGTTQWIAQLGLAYGLTGQPEKAREILRRLEVEAMHGYVSPYQLVFVYTGMGEYERALDLLEIAVQEHAGAAYGIKGSFLLAPLKSHRRFQALLRRMNLA